MSEPISHESRDTLHHPRATDEELFSELLEFGLEDGIWDKSETEHLTQIYLDKRPLSERIDPLIAELNERVVPDEKVSERVMRARYALNYIAELTQKNLKQEETAMMLFGSAVYDDPRNLDPDIWLISDKSTDQGDLFGEALSGVIDPLWEKIVGGEYTGCDLTVSSVDQLRALHDAYLRNDDDFISANGTFMAGSMEKFSVIFTGLPLSVPHPDFIAVTQKEIRDLAEKNIFIAGALHSSFDHALGIRKERAAKKSMK